MTENEFVGLVRDRSPRLIRAVRPLTETHADAEEIVQDAWVAVWNSRGDRPVEDISDAWLYGIAINIAKSKHRKVSRRRLIMDEQTLGPGVVTNQRPIEAKLLLDEVWTEISNLPDGQRTVLLARLIDGRSVGEVADSIGRAPGTVKAHLHHALTKLRDRFGKSVEDALGRVSVSSSERRSNDAQS